MRGEGWGRVKLEGSEMGIWEWSEMGGHGGRVKVWCEIGGVRDGAWWVEWGGQGFREVGPKGRSLRGVGWGLCSMEGMLCTVHTYIVVWHDLPMILLKHFVCASCEKAFDGRRHYERKGLAYCETHYTELFGEICFSCGRPCTSDDIVRVFGKHWCNNHFRCVACDTSLAVRGGAHYVDADERPYCKKCMERYPQEYRKRLKQRKEAWKVLLINLCS
jgi:transposase-like protein